LNDEPGVSSTGELEESDRRNGRQPQVATDTGNTSVSETVKCSIQWNCSSDLGESVGRAEPLDNQAVMCYYAATHTTVDRTVSDKLSPQIVCTWTVKYSWSSFMTTRTASVEGWRRTCMSGPGSRTAA